MIAMITLAVVAVMIFFGLTDGYFKRMGVPNWTAFLVVLVFAVASVFPPLVTPGNVSLSYAGFFLPIILCAVCLFAIGANSNLMRCIAALLSIAGVIVATRISLSPLRNSVYFVSCVMVSGVVSSAVACIITQNRLGVLASLLGGVVLGDFITAMLYRFVTGATDNLLVLGQNGIFDTIVVGAFIGAIGMEIGALIAKSLQQRTKLGTGRATQLQTVNAEIAQDNDIPEQSAKHTEEDDLYDDYFNDDID